MGRLGSQWQSTSCFMSHESFLLYSFVTLVEGKAGATGALRELVKQAEKGSLHWYQQVMLIMSIPKSA